MSVRVVVSILLGTALGVTVADRVLASDLSVAVKFAKGIFGKEISDDYKAYIDSDPDEALTLILEWNRNDSFGAASSNPSTRLGFAHLGKLRLAYSELKPILEEASLTSGLPAELIDAVIRTESGYRPQAISRTGAQGLMQLMPKTARSLGVTDSMDPRQNVLGGSRYLRKMLDRFGRISFALAAYNAGPKAVVKYKGVPPYKETQRYVKVVWKRYQMRLSLKEEKSPHKRIVPSSAEEKLLRPSSYQ